MKNEMMAGYVDMAHSFEFATYGILSSMKYVWCCSNILNIKQYGFTMEYYGVYCNI